ncbi:MAG: NADH-quinone oxidoreductase subunit D [Dehalococcoidia bacterium]|nr:NADH-quinone oxidoreductase subunit D [Dehalococcoidia bacterium]
MATTPGTPATYGEEEFETRDILLNVGPQHPSTHGVFRMVLSVDGEVVRDLIPYIGYMHRGGEKLSETMDYRQGIGYMDRTEYLGQLNAELSYVMAVERLADVQVPERADWIRMILVEFNRLTSHFLFMGAFGIDVGVFATPMIYAWVHREAIIDLLEEISGERVMYSYFRAGGLAWDVPVNFKERSHQVLKVVRQGIQDFDRLLTDNEIFIARTKGVGVIPVEDAIDYGLSGPVLRSFGVPMDIRRDEPYLKYDDVEWDVITGATGDVFDRYYCRLLEMKESVRIIEQCLERLPDRGPIMPERFPRMLRTPPGEVYLRTEAPRGEYGIYLVSRGGNRPHRLKIRSSSFSNLQALKAMSVGQYVADAIIILGSLDIVLCECDR